MAMQVSISLSSFNLIQIVFVTVGIDAYIVGALARSLRLQDTIRLLLGGCFPQLFFLYIRLVLYLRDTCA